MCVVHFVAVLLSSVGCITDPDNVRWDSLWRVKNATGKTVRVVLPNGWSTLAPDETVDIYRRSEFGNSPYFEMMMVLWRRPAGEEIAFEVLSTNGEVLKRWEFQKNDYESSSSRNFFRQNSWIHYSDHEKRRKKWDEWTFEILP